MSCHETSHYFSRAVFRSVVLFSSLVLSGALVFAQPNEGEDSSEQARGNGEDVPAMEGEVVRPQSARERVAQARGRREHLTSLAARVRSLEAIDTLRGLSEEDKGFLRRRYNILHPLD